MVPRLSGPETLHENFTKRPPWLVLPPDNRALYWGPNVDLLIGTQMDFAGAVNGTLDEFHIHDLAIPRTQFLYTPDPSSAVLLALGLTGLAIRRRK